MIDAPTIEQLYDRMVAAELRHDNERTEANRVASMIAEADYQRALTVEARARQGEY